MNRIVFINPTPGVGKTILIREIGICLGLLEKKTLLVDCDPQGNLSLSLGAEDDCLYQGLTGKNSDLYQPTENTYLLSGNHRLGELKKESTDPRKLKKLFRRTRLRDFKVVLIDTPPNLGLMTTIAMAAADLIIIPIIPRLYSVEKLSQLMSFIAKSRLELNRKIRLLGVVSVSDSTEINTLESEEEIIRTFGEKLFSTRICEPIWKLFDEDEEPVDVRGVEEMVTPGILSLTKEILERIGEEV